MHYNNSELLVMQNMSWDSTFICELVLQISYRITFQIHRHLEVSLYQKEVKDLNERKLN